MVLLFQEKNKNVRWATWGGNMTRAYLQPSLAGMIAGPGCGLVDAAMQWLGDICRLLKGLGPRGAASMTGCSGSGPRTACNYNAFIVAYDLYYLLILDTK